MKTINKFRSKMLAPLLICFILSPTALCGKENQKSALPPIPISSKSQEPRSTLPPNYSAIPDPQEPPQYTPRTQVRNNIIRHAIKILIDCIKRHAKQGTPV